MSNKRILATLFAIVGALSLAACSGPATQPEPASPASAATESDALAELQATGVLKVGTEGTYAPFTFHDTATGDLTGYDVEVVTAVAEKLGVVPEFSEVKWDGIFAGLEAGRYDVIANQVSVTPEREELYSFSTPYAISRPVIVTASSNTDVTSIGDVKGRSAAQTATSNWGEFAIESGAELVPVDGFTEAVAAVRDGRVELTFNDNLAVAEYFTTTGDDSVKVAVEVPEKQSNQALALRADSPLTPLIDQALSDLAADGTLAEIGQKYFGTDISK